MSSTTTTTPTPSTCAGTSYTIKAGDTCQSISESQGIGTTQLLEDNNLAAYCSNFPTSGDLCIQNKCTTYTLSANDTCRDIGRKHLLTEVQLTTWNPILGSNYRHINHSISNSICISPPGDSKWSPITIPSNISTATATATPVPVPTNIANGTISRYGEYYLIQLGDYCNKIIIKYSISLEDFLFLNGRINQNCTNLFAKESYCVQPAGPINEYPSHTGYIPPEASITYLPDTKFPMATFVPPSINQTASLPYAPGTRKDCYLYATGSELQVDLGASSYDSTCELIAAVKGISPDTLLNWNPSLNTTSNNCAFDERCQYCLAAYKTTQTILDSTLFPTTVTITDVPATTEPISTSTETSTATSTATTTTSAGPPSPTQSGIPDTCNKWHVVEEGDTCYDLAAANNITLNQFYEWNPAVKNDCAEGFWLGNAYCVGISELIEG